MSVECFIDTNVFLYQLDETDRRKHAIAEQIVSRALADASACISFQVIQECLNGVLRKAEIKLDPVSTLAYLETVLEPLCRVESSLDLYREALTVQGRYRFGFYDSLIVAAALEADCTRLYTEDLQHGQKIGRLTIHDPFRR